MLDLLITDAAVLLPDGTVRSGQTVEIENGIIKDVRPFCGGDLVMEAQERLDGTGKLVMPGACGLSHAYRAAAPQGKSSGCPAHDLDQDHAAF